MTNHGLVRFAFELYFLAEIYQIMAQNNTIDLTRSFIDRTAKIWAK